MPKYLDLRVSASLFFKAAVFAFMAYGLSACSTSGSAPGGTNGSGDQPSHKEDMVVYKSPFCLCCKDWITHLQQNAINVGSENGLDTASVKQKWGVPPSMQGCHTGVWRNQYVFEGHVPARLIRKFLSDPPKDSIGLAVPGMPQGSPGMYRGGDFEPYVVYLIMTGGEYRFYEKVTSPEPAGKSV
ncbi:DUF411 domain-containing protein [Microbulbifer sp. CAU 1566]|uniref:DUF411 domain-containing protein n=1 Tax=Microbulbifer sp. CAU 1566 TaxID=2933269 RepID=UPI0020047AF4|nr:DUF411 domain-containing protein [Microbulbifer sp. CAU 1566]MCK7596820.1 DUF411 domain-containing protein [Microbulbifer sp. CAU 1566]